MAKIIGGTTSTPLKPVDVLTTINKDIDAIIKSNVLDKRTVYYYSTIAKAISDITKKSLTNADSDKDNAEVCVWESDPTTDEKNRIYYNCNLMLLKDVVGNVYYYVETSKRINVRLILNGKTLNGYISFNRDTLYIDGTKQGSKITFSGDYQRYLINCPTLTIDGGTYELNSTATGGTTPVNLIRYSNDSTGRYNGNFNFNNATFNLTSIANNSRVVVAEQFNISNCKFNVSIENTSTYIFGTAVCLVNHYSTDGYPKPPASTISNSTITSTSNTNGTFYGIHNDGELTVNDTTIYCDAPNNAYDETGNVSKAIQSNENAMLTINGGKYTGTHTAVSSKGDLFVDGGTFVSCSHGGFYLGGGADKQIFIKNAAIGCEAYNGVYDKTAFANKNPLGTFYIGGSQDTGSNTSVYVDNCTLLEISEQSESIVFRKGTYEHDNKLYISNTLIPGTKKIRNSETNNLYIGLGTNITSDNLSNPTLENYFYTDEGYAYENQYTNKRVKIIVGDIETALDGIIAIQEELIGGNA